MFTIRFRSLTAAAGLAALTLVLAAPGAPAESGNSASTVVLDLTGTTVGIPCANSGAGDTITLAGAIHLVSHLTVRPDGSFVGSTHSNSECLSGVGAAAQDKYQIGMLSNETFIDGKTGVRLTFEQDLHMIGHGGADNFVLHGIFHLTVHPDGTVSADVDHLESSCGA